MSTPTTTSNKVSIKASKIEASITMAIAALAKKLKKEGQDVIGLSAGEPDFDTPDNIKEAGIQAIKDGKTKYTPAAGLIELKEAVCDKFKRDQGLSYTPENVVISCGAKHTIYNILIAITNPGDDILIPSPYWVSYPDQVNLADGTPVFLETTEATQFKISAVQFENAITSKTKVLILNSPSNPTGMLYTKQELEAIAAVAVKHDILIISDEIYEELVYEGDHVCIATLSDEIKNLTIVVNGVSKAYSMTGWRIGYCAAPVDIAKAMSKIQSHSTSNPTAPSQWAAIEALNGSQEAVATMRKAFDERRQYAVNRLNKINNISCLMPQGAFYAFPNISGCFGKKSKSGTINNAADFCEFLLKESLVACVPGSGFGGEGFIRLSYATSMALIKEALDRLEAWVKTLI
jgi:aspartate aminotransferase